MTHTGVELEKEWKKRKTENDWMNKKKRHTQGIYGGNACPEKGKNKIWNAHIHSMRWLAGEDRFSATGEQLVKFHEKNGVRERRTARFLFIKIDFCSRCLLFLLARPTAASDVRGFSYLSIIFLCSFFLLLCVLVMGFPILVQNNATKCNISNGYVFLLLFFFAGVFRCL